LAKIGLFSFSKDLLPMAIFLMTHLMLYLISFCKAS